MRLTPYIPVILFGAWAMYSSWRLPRWRGNPQYLKQPDRPVWGFWQYLGDSAWTDDGRALRNRILRDMGVGLLVAIAGVILTLALEARGY